MDSVNEKASVYGKRWCKQNLMSSINEKMCSKSNFPIKIVIIGRVGLTHLVATFVSSSVRPLTLLHFFRLFGCSNWITSLCQTEPGIALVSRNRFDAIHVLAVMSHNLCYDMPVSTHLCVYVWKYVSCH